METNLLIAGFGGQGVMVLGQLISYAVCDNSEKKVTFFPSYGAEQRGGTANCYVVISDKDVGAPISDVMDDLIAMNAPSLNKFLPMLKPGGNLFINSSIVKDKIERNDVKVIEAPVTELSLAMGNAKVLNVIMLGVYVGYTGILPSNMVEQTMLEKLGRKAELIQMNKDAFAKGLEIGIKAKSA